MTPRAHALVPLERLIARVEPLAVVGDPTGVVVREVVFDHRLVTPGALFCCIVGAHHDGHTFAAPAAEKGAAAFLCEHSLGGAAYRIPQLVVAPGTARHAMALASCALYDDPARAMTTIGVTGTNGKTTTTFLLRSIFEQASRPTAVLGTLDGARTTPEAPILQRSLAEFVDAGYTTCALEVTSHALVQQRVDGVRFDAALFTNLSQDHLDFHQTMEAYFEAKALLFTPERARTAVVNADDAYGRRLLERRAVPTVGYSIEDVRDLAVGLRESRFRLGGLAVRLPLGGMFNVLNALGAAATARALGVGAREIVAGLEAVPQVPGRFEALDAGLGVEAIVDFAHTPAGLEGILRAARASAAERNGRVLLVFGAGGDRDRGKRPAMGAVAGELADEIFLTSDNPRSEDPLAIISDIAAGLRCATPHHVEPDRRKAIAAALGRATAGDVVVVAGKGHETTQQFADRVVPFDDRIVVAELARKRAAGAPVPSRPEDS